MEKIVISVILELKENELVGVDVKIPRTLKKRLSPVEKKEKAKVDTIPYAEIQAAFNEVVYELPVFHSLTDKRRKAIRGRWNTDEKTCTLEWWREEFFPRVARSDFLCGRAGKKWACNIDWILNPENFEKIREGTYDNR